MAVAIIPENVKPSEEESYRQGWEAQTVGLANCHNPYRFLTDRVRHDTWRLGWQHAFESKPHTKMSPSPVDIAKLVDALAMQNATMTQQDAGSAWHKICRDGIEIGAVCLCTDNTVRVVYFTDGLMWNDLPVGCEHFPENVVQDIMQYADAYIAFVEANKRDSAK